jgi:hypothetical protein
VTQGQVRVPATKTSGKFGQFPAQVKSWSATGLANHLHIAPSDALSPTGANSFHPSLFGSEAGSKTFSHIRPGGTVADLFRRKDTGEEALSKALQGSPDPVHLSYVNSCAYNHLAVIKVP